VHNMFEAPDVVAAAISRSEIEVRSSAAEGKSLSPWKVLFVDDDPGSSMKIGGILLNKGCQVTLRRTLTEALLLLKSHCFDLLVAGLREDPRRECMQLRAVRDLYPEMKIVVFTDDPSAVSNEEQFPLIDNFIAKPGDAAGIRDKLKNWLQSLELADRRSLACPKSQPVERELQHLLMIMSHDLRGSLISLGAGLRLLAGGHFGQVDADASQKAAGLYERVKNLTGITEDFLGKAYSLTEEVEIESEKVDLLDDIIGPVLDEVLSEAGDRGVEIVLDRAVESGRKLPVQADRVWLKTVVRNLLGNAIKYGDRGAAVQVGVAAAGNAYRINVYNSGPPIPEKFRPKLFEKFARLPRNRSKAGMGLGLYLIREIVLRHGGNIWYEPKENGSNFVFTLPKTV